MTVGWTLADLAEPAADAPTVLSTFSCGGGSSMGYKLAGCRVVGAVDIDPVVIDIYERNMPGIPTYTGSIESIPDHLRDQWRELDLDILDGSPPCTVFSSAGKREQGWGKEKAWAEGRAVQVLDRLFYSFMDLVDDLHPKIFLAENVMGMMKGNAKGYVSQVVRLGRDHGYDVQVVKMSAQNYGVPQQRQRLFFVGRRLDLDLPPFQVPRPQPYVTAGQAFADLASATEMPITRKDRDLIWWQIKPGESSTAYDKRIGWLRHFRSQKLHPDRIARTIVTIDGILHWAEPRHVTVEEILRLGSFPDDYKIEAKHVKYVIGMSVPPLLIKAIAGQLRRMLERGRQ